MKLRTSSSHEEGANRNWSVSTKSFEGDGERVSSLTLNKIQWDKDSDGKMFMKKPQVEFTSKNQNLVLLAMGFVCKR